MHPAELGQADLAGCSCSLTELGTVLCGHQVLLWTIFSAGTSNLLVVAPGARVFRGGDCSSCAASLMACSHGLCREESLASPFWCKGDGKGTVSVGPWLCSCAGALHGATAWSSWCEVLFAWQSSSGTSDLLAVGSQGLHCAACVYIRLFGVLGALCVPEPGVLEVMSPIRAAGSEVGAGKITFCFIPIVSTFDCVKHVKFMGDKLLEGMQCLTTVRDRLLGWVQLVFRVRLLL